MDIQTLQLMARYNVWATQRLGSVLRTVTTEDFNKKCGLFFQSIAGTLNHLLVGEHGLWYPRFHDQGSPQMALNTILETDQMTLIRTLEEKAHLWLPFLDMLDPAILAGDFHYQTSTGKPICAPYGATLLHVFNHGTHHRGQVTAALTAMGYPCPELDLVYMLLEK